MPPGACHAETNTRIVGEFLGESDAVTLYDPDGTGPNNYGDSTASHAHMARTQHRHLLHRSTQFLHRHRHLHPHHRAFLGREPAAEGRPLSWHKSVATVSTGDGQLVRVARRQHRRMQRVMAAGVRRQAFIAVTGCARFRPLRQH